MTRTPQIGKGTRFLVPPVLPRATSRQSLVSAAEAARDPRNRVPGGIPRSAFTLPSRAPLHSTGRRAPPVLLGSLQAIVVVSTPHRHAFLISLASSVAHAAATATDLKCPWQIPPRAQPPAAPVRRLPRPPRACRSLRQVRGPGRWPRRRPPRRPAPRSPQSSRPEAPGPQRAAGQKRLSPHRPQQAKAPRLSAPRWLS